MAAVVAVLCFLGGCASTKSDSVFYGETPYTLETDTMKRLNNEDVASEKHKRNMVLRGLRW